MKKLLVFLAFIFLSQFNFAHAINWVSIDTPSGRSAYLDSDSITEYENYYFYNVKMASAKDGSPIVVTIQSQVRKPMSATLRVYTSAQYKELNGDYQNITQNMKTKLEPVTYESLVYACFKKVKMIELSKKNFDIQFN